MAISPHSRLGRYEIRSQLGAGGMCEVYLARDPKINRDVAIKVLPADFSSDPERLRRFELEVEATGKLNHPNILAIYDVETQDGSPFVVCELLEGETLRERIRTGAFSARQAVDYALQIAHGLTAAHKKGIIHRDLKPENIFITNDGRIKILDFGLAKLTEAAPNTAGQTDVLTRKVNTDPGAVMGTAGYMSPEQVRAQRIDHRSDIFSLGAILYEMLSGKRAFHGDSAIETLNAILKEDPPELSESESQINPALERVVMHCLEKRPEQKFQSANDVAFALEALSGLSSSRILTEALPVKVGRRLKHERLAWVISAVFFSFRRLSLRSFILLRVNRPASMPYSLRYFRQKVVRISLQSRSHRMERNYSVFGSSVGGTSIESCEPSSTIPDGVTTRFPRCAAIKSRSTA
jgi:eukaryotic-like serine/threonine-protein kinase